MLDSLDIFAEVEEIETDATLIQLMRKCFPVCSHLNHFYVEIRPAYTFYLLSIQSILEATAFQKMDVAWL
jgi:hypothetical protein